MGDLVKSDGAGVSSQLWSVIEKSQADLWYFHVETIHGSNFICGRIYQLQYLPILHLLPLEDHQKAAKAGVLKFSNGHTDGYVIPERGIDVPIANIVSIGDGLS